MALNFKSTPFTPRFTIGINGTGLLTRTTLALNSAYTYSSAGAGLAINFNAPKSGNLTDVYVYSSALTGTPASITIGIELRNATTAGTIGLTQHAVQTATITATANKWTRITFGTPYSVTVGLYYAITVYNASGAPTIDYPTIVTGSAFPRDDTGATISKTTTNGFSTGSNLSNSPCFVGVIAGTPFGLPYSSSMTNSTSSTNERGLVFTSPAVAVKAFGASWNSAGNFVNTGLKLLKGATLPNATPGTGELAIDITTVLQNDFVFITETTLDASSIYRLVADPVASSTARPQYIEIEDYAAFADVQAAALYNGAAYYTEQSGSAFVDYPERFPVMMLLLSEIVAGGSGGMIGGGNLSGGFQ